jgi:hypothetical protein
VDLRWLNGWTLGRGKASEEIPNSLFETFFFVDDAEPRTNAVQVAAGPLPWAVLIGPSLGSLLAQLGGYTRPALMDILQQRTSRLVVVLALYD